MRVRGQKSLKTTKKVSVNLKLKTRSSCESFHCISIAQVNYFIKTVLFRSVTGLVEWISRVALGRTRSDLRLTLAGDNILTALSVARECRMIAPADSTLLVDVLPPSDGEEATIRWTYADNTPGGAKGAGGVEFQVAPPVDEFRVSPQTFRTCIFPAL